MNTFTWIEDDQIDADESWRADTDEGTVYVYTDEQFRGMGDTPWAYNIILGHMTGGSRLDPPEFVEDVDVYRGGFVTRADATFAAQRHYDRLMIADQVALEEENAMYEQMLADEQREIDAMQEHLRRFHDTETSCRELGDLYAMHDEYHANHDRLHDEMGA